MVGTTGDTAGTASAAGFDKASLLKDLRRQVTTLEDDLRARTELVDGFARALRREYGAALERQRTAATYETWRDERVTQAAAAWVLATVFVRFCEDNDLIEHPFIAGPGERLAEAEDRHAAFFQEHPEQNDRDWLITAFEHLSGTNATVAGLFDKKHNALWELTPSYEAATELLTFWRERGADGKIRHDFTDREGLDTRFLGDLYQDLSEHARKTYALLQTPEFVEEFILDLTLEPAVDEFGLDPEWTYRPSRWAGGADGGVVRGLRCIDPACGSGHFLLGMFERLLAKWRATEPGTDGWELIRRTLESVHGCDKNPFAVAIARFRLLVAVLKASGERRLASMPHFPINVAVGDSLLHGRGAETVTEDLFAAMTDEPFLYATEDTNEFAARCDLLGRGSYHVVVGNPPYITVKDKQENENYRRAYDACAGTYALSVPFAQRIFELAVRGVGDQRTGGFTGQITANSFMKREFGRKLIERFFLKVELTHLIDTSGAYIPGHATPTVILAGRNQNWLRNQRVRAVLGVRGEPYQPRDPSKGIVWSAISNQIDLPGSESDWINVEDLSREQFSTSPWSLSGGGAGRLFSEITDASPKRLRSEIKRIGFFGMTHADDVMTAPARIFARERAEHTYHRPFTVGEDVRDWSAGATANTFYPYDGARRLVPLEFMPGHGRRLWPFRTELGNRATFSGGTYFSDSRPWHEWHQFPKDSETHPWSIALAFVATHNQFSLECDEKAFKQTAPVIKLPEGATEDAHLALLGVLNSSTGCFWLKQVCHDKGSQSGTGGFMHDEWERFYEFTGTKLQEFPLPASLSVNSARVLNTLAQELSSHEPAAFSTSGATPSRERLDAIHAKYTRPQGQMIALQEELDWQVYGLYGLLERVEADQLTVPEGTDVPPVALGERAFEIVLARKVAAGEAETVWFTRHGSIPITNIPDRWPNEYKAIVQARIDVITSRKDIALIERPECKRRWASEPWEKKEREALRTWLLDRCEAEHLWFALRDGMKQPRALTVSQFADALRTDDDVQSVAALYATDHLGKRDATLAKVLAEIIATEHVPYLAALRYKEPGLRKRTQWERVWDLQREEDGTGKRLDIPVPPKYTSADFLRTSYWSHRGKLDVPKERFISYPGASPDGDTSLLLGWAGWDHKDQTQALINIVNDRTDQAAWGTERIIPLLAGIQELMPWVHQWHGEYDEAWEGSPAEEYQAYLDQLRAQHQVSAADLTAWRPPRKARKGKTAE